MRKDKEKFRGKFPWLDDTDERKHMTDREILDKYVNLDKLLLNQGRERAGNRYMVSV